MSISVPNNPKNPINNEAVISLDIDFDLMFKHLTTTAYLQNKEDSITHLVITNVPENYVMFS